MSANDLRSVATILPPVAPGAVSALLAHLFSATEREPGARRMRALRPGANVGSFEVIREIGRGGFGVVYEARDRSRGLTVALKMIVPADRPEVNEERLLCEAETAARLSHPNIVTTHDVGRSERGPYVVLERLEGETLANRLRRGALPLREALRIATEIARGVAHAHDNGVVHRDLTPGNVFLCHDGAVKVLDFGMAHVFGRRKLEGGTRRYMAPEQACGAPEDERSDVFALGVILFEMASGRLPCAHSRRSGGAVRPVLDLRVPQAPLLTALVAAMLSEDPVRRPRDGGEVVARLLDAQRELRPALEDGGDLAVRTVRRRAPRSRPHARRRSIAVLPFVDLSDLGDQHHLSDGFAEAILNALALVPGIHVVGRTSSFAFRGRQDARVIGSRLGVGLILEGSVQKARDRVRIQAQLVDVERGFCSWSRTFDRQLSDVFAVQDEIAGAVVAAMPVPRRRAPDRREHATRNMDSYVHYLVGRQLRTRGATRPNIRRAIASFERALALDARFALAWAGLAEALHVQADYVETTAQVAAIRRRELVAARNAVRFGPSLPDGYRQRAILSRACCAWEAAQSDLDVARKLGAIDAGTLREQGRLRAAVGEVRDGIPFLVEALRVDPLDPRNWYFLGVLQIAAGELASGGDAFRRAWEVAPDSPGAPFGLGMVSLLQRDPETARSHFRRAGDRYRQLGLVMAETDLGHTAASRNALQVLTRRYEPIAPATVAKAHAWRGELDRAFELLERARLQHDPVLTSIRHDPLYRNVREDRRYEALLARMKLAFRRRRAHAPDG